MDDTTASNGITTMCSRMVNYFFHVSLSPLSVEIQVFFVEDYGHVAKNDIHTMNFVIGTLDFNWFHCMQNKIYSRLRMNPAADEILVVITSIQVLGV